MKRILSANRAAAGPLVLVNAGHPLKNPEALPRLTRLADAPDGSGVLLDVAAARMMARLIAACGGFGSILPVSGFRSQARQVDIFNETLREKGEHFTRQYVALPGCSEHQTGLALDVADAGADYDFIRPAFPEDGLCGRFRRLAALYGFIERYPQGKSGLTGIAHEPWHFRYVGAPHAATMAEHGLTLEEYIRLLEDYDSPNNALYHRSGAEYRVKSYTARPENGRFTLKLPENALWQASGNNAGGLVVTLWQ